VPSQRSLKTKQDFIQSDVINAKSDINVSLNEKMQVKNLNKVYKAGQKISLTKNVTFEKGSTLLADIDEDLPTVHTMRQSIISCVYFSNTITPNGDGKNDFLLMRQKGVGSYRIVVRDRWNRKKFDSGQVDVYQDGIIKIYDGKNTQNGANRATVEYWDIFNQKKSQTYIFNQIKTQV
jgi:hypothetical protein